MFFFISFRHFIEHLAYAFNIAKINKNCYVYAPINSSFFMYVTKGKKKKDIILENSNTDGYTNIELKHTLG